MGSETYVCCDMPQTVMGESFAHLGQWAWSVVSEPVVH
jgi:hypothetical protein